MGPRRFVKFALALAVVLAAASWLVRARPVAHADETARRNATPVAAQAEAIRTAIPETFPAPRPGPVDGRVDAEASAAAPAQKRANADPALFGKLVALGQGLELGEALEQNARMADAYVDRLCDEGRKLHDHPALPDVPSHDRDAAEFMAPLIDYETPLDDPPGRLHVAGALADRVKGYGTDWPAKISDRDLEGLDFGWLSALGAYDHWSLFGAGRLREQPLGEFFTAPIPNYLSLLLWTKLRFAVALRSGDLAQASAEVRHLAALIRTQSILIAEMVAVAIYRLDARAREVAAAKGFDTTGWPEPDVDQIDRHRRIALASLYFTFPGVKPETVRKAVECMPSPCSALLEGAGANRTFGPYGGFDNLDLVSDLARDRGCESAILDRARGARELQASEALSSAAEDVGQQIPKRFEGLPN